MLAAQGALFLWMTDRIAGSMPARDPRRLAVLVASDVGAALSAEPGLDLEEYVREQYGHVFQTFVVIMQDGRTASNHDDVPDELLEALVAENGRREFPAARRFGRFGDPPPGPGAPAHLTRTRRRAIRRTRAVRRGAAASSRPSSSTARWPVALPSCLGARRSRESCASSARRWGSSAAACSASAWR